MKLAVLSDVHANFVALASACNYIEKTDTDGVIFLGDYVTDDRPNPDKSDHIPSCEHLHIHEWHEMTELLEELKNE